jgi:two-component system OmpR family sensor kinase
VIGAVALVSLVGADIAVYTSFRSSLLSSLDATLDATHAPIERALGGGGPSHPAGAARATPPGGDQGDDDLPGGGQAPESTNPPGTGFCAEIGPQLGAGTVVEELTPSGSVLAHSACVSGGTLSAGASPVILPTSSGSSGSAGTPGPPVHFSASSTKGTTQYRVAELTLGNGDRLIVATTLAPTDHSLSRLLLEEILATAAALVVALLLGTWLVRVGLRPLVAVERAAEEITEGDLALRVPGEDARTEVGSLARTINTMLRRIEVAFAERDATASALRASERRLRQFVADASHELRTPIAAVSAYAELFEKGAAEPEHRADLERVMRGIRSETVRMGGLVEDLLLLARLDEHRAVASEPVEIVALCSEAVRTAAAVGPGWPVRLEAAEPVECVGDPVRLRQVVDNLLLNVRAHTPEGTTTVLSVRTSPSTVTIEVADDGPGFSTDDIDRVFERFWRGDPSRARSSGGSGLGLAIVAGIVEGHGGTVHAANGEHAGAVVTVTLPISPE